MKYGSALIGIVLAFRNIILTQVSLWFECYLLFAHSLIFECTNQLGRFTLCYKLADSYRVLLLWLWENGFTRNIR